MAGENLLVVDDSPTILKAVEAALTRAGYHVDTAGDVSSGMALARARRPAVILVDSLIPADAMGGPDAGNASARASSATKAWARPPVRPAASVFAAPSPPIRPWRRRPWC